MFLTGIREEMQNQEVAKKSDILKNELSDLFVLVASEDDVRWVVETHIRLLAGGRGNLSQGEAKELLIYCNQVLQTLDIDTFFENRIDKQTSFEKSSYLAEIQERESENLVTDLKVAGIQVC